MNPVNARLLIVDDCPSMREIVGELMLDLGIGSVETAADGQVALELLAQNQYDLVLSDWNMPFFTGLQVLRAVRQGRVRSDTPIVLLSGDVTADRQAEAFEAGATDLLQKPFPTPQLCEKVLNIIASLAPAPEYLQAPHQLFQGKSTGSSSPLFPSST